MEPGAFQVSAGASRPVLTLGNVTVARQVRGRQEAAPAVQYMACKRGSSPTAMCASTRRRRHVRRATRDSGCIRVGAVPEVGSSNAIARSQKVCPPLA